MLWTSSWKICYELGTSIISCTKCITILYTSSYCFNPSTIQGWRCVRIWCTSRFIWISDVVFLACIVSINVNQLLWFNTVKTFPYQNIWIHHDCNLQLPVSFENVWKAARKAPLLPTPPLQWTINWGLRSSEILVIKILFMRKIGISKDWPRSYFDIHNWNTYLFDWL